MGQCNLLLNYPVYRERTTRSHTFIRADVRATGRRSFKDDITSLFGTGTMHAVFQAAGTVFVEKHALNITQKMRASCSAHVLSTHGAMLSGPLALLGFACWIAHQTSSSLVPSFKRHHPQQMPYLKTSWICRCFAKNCDNWNNWRIDSVH